MTRRVDPRGGRRCRLRGVLLAVVLPLLTAAGHDSPEHRIAELTALIKGKTDTAYPLFLRAVEYRTLGRLERAALDLDSALRQRTNYVAALGELGRIRLAQRQPQAALIAVDRALALAGEDDDTPALHALRAEIALTLGRTDEALIDCQKAVTGGAGDIESYLLRAQLEARLGRFRDAAAGLRTGWETTGSIVLKEEWIDALLDAGDATAAAPLVNDGLARSRLRSAWLLRRARLHRLQGSLEAARDDLHTVLQSLDTGYRHAVPDVALVVNHGLASALLGDVTTARQDLERAQRLGATAAAMDRLQRSLPPHTAPVPERPTGPNPR